MSDLTRVAGLARTLRTELDETEKLMAHTVLNLGDLVAYDGWLCGWMTARVLDIVTVPGTLPGTTRNDVRIEITARTAKAHRRGEVLTVQSRDVLPRKGWHRGNGGTRYHLPGFCHAWESCEKCNRTVFPQVGAVGYPYVTVTQPDSGHVLVTGAVNGQSAWQHAERAGYDVRLSVQTATGVYSLTLEPRITNQEAT